MKLNREVDAKPLYLQLESIIRNDIENGVYSQGDLLPSESQYMEIYNVSRVTVRQAFAILEQNKFIKRYRGKGTIVTHEKIGESISQVISFTDEMKKHNISMNTSFCTIEKTVPNTKVASALGILKTDPCFKLTRVRNVDDAPIVFTITWLKSIVDLPLDEKEYEESLYKMLSDRFGIVIAHCTDTLEAALPNDIVKNRLQIDDSMPIFIRVRQGYLSDGNIYEYSVSYYPGNRYKYIVEI